MNPRGTLFQRIQFPTEAVDFENLQIGLRAQSMQTGDQLVGLDGCSVVASAVVYGLLGKTERTCCGRICHNRRSILLLFSLVCGLCHSHKTELMHSDDRSCASKLSRYAQGDQRSTTEPCGFSWKCDRF